MTQSRVVTATDGIALAVHAYAPIDRSRPTVVAIHGYPDNHHVWDGVADELGGRYNVVAFDVRGSGESGTPARRSGYRFAQLVADIGTVIDSIGVDRVHLVAHDWGSIQAWAAVTDDSVAPKIASFTSISGPHLNYAGAFLRSARTPRGVIDVVRQVLASSYIGFFLCPGVPELTIWARATTSVFALVELLGRPRGSGQRRAATTRSLRDYLNGLNLYRANMPAPFLANRLPRTAVPVQTLVARRDYFVSPPLQRFTGSIPPHGRVVPIEGGHWVVASHPGVIARLTGEWVDQTAAARARDIS
ncbi:alpha/beta hydrolase [Mycobacterium sp. E2462]|uniref:alpha/beta fold hydrolase n=1 Tax=Mycobacterium sp. E2462 TaxID=1834133 RepID=UPI0007FEAD1E|nr:alpha/beta fold hydrolase [Mycobacterium sp. E2462]OBI14215.1 alpha/beta hydrolase [Mycobacterium sp. E2462]